MYSKDQVLQLNNEFKLAISGLSKLGKICHIKFINSETEEYVTHGFWRRTITIKRCVKNIYALCPPSNKKPLSYDISTDLNINIQSFVINIYGALDNLAWIGVKEKNIKSKKGRSLTNTQIGFSKKFETIRKSYSSSFQEYLESLDEWYLYLESFRHSLAHRIPLYVPPSSVSKNDADLAQKLLNDFLFACAEDNLHKKNKLHSELESLKKFFPVMTHSFSESSSIVKFHAQIIADSNTLIDIANKFLEELNK